MKKQLQIFLCLAFWLPTLLPLYSHAQCAPGYTRDTLNWDYLDFLPNSGAYVSPVPFVSLAQSQRQYFTFGKLTVTVVHNYSGNNIFGEVTTHTGELGSFGAGADLRFRNDGTVSFTFSEPVMDLRFSIFDIDQGQKIAVVANNNGTATAIDASTLSGSILTVSGTGTSAVSAEAALSNVSATANSPAANGTLNVAIPGAVTSISITATNSGTATGEDASYYISDLHACASGFFPMNYYQIAKPFAGQPAYFLAVRNNEVYYVNVATGVARLLFRDLGHTNINSLAYDPYRHMVYYSYSLTNSPQTDRKIFRFDYDMDTLGVVIPNVNDLGIPTFQTGVESGAAGFYDKAYYLGIEGNDGAGTNSSRESIIWRIDFDSNHHPITAAQVWAIPADDGNGTSLHDWSDIGFNDGILYDFDGAGSQTDFYHKDLLTGTCVNIKPSPASLIPRQVSVSWTGQMYNSGSSSAMASGSLAPYNGNGTVNGSLQRTMTYQGVAVAGSWGDAGEAFKPKTDFGDAPASYDPASIDPGTHERNDSIRLGLTIGIEWNKKTTADASGDGTEEDGVTGLQVVPAGLSNYLLPVSVYNITGRNARLVGWIDANGNGIFESSEAATTLVASAAGQQVVTLNWPAIFVTVPLYSQTFLRLRLCTDDQGITGNKPNGYFDNGEIEDHPITVSLVLPAQNIGLQVQKLNQQVIWKWELNDESGLLGYLLQRSCDGQLWETIAQRNATNGNNYAQYTGIDPLFCNEKQYYRVQVLKLNGGTLYSRTAFVTNKQDCYFSISPNPVRQKALLTIYTPKAATAFLQVFDAGGRLVLTQKLALNAAVQDVLLPGLVQLPAGNYQVRVQCGSYTGQQSLILAP